MKLKMIYVLAERRGSFWQFYCPTLVGEWSVAFQNHNSENWAGFSVYWGYLLPELLPRIDELGKFQIYLFRYNQL